MPVGYLHQLCPDRFCRPWLDETPGAAMLEQYSLTTHSVAITDPCTRNAAQLIHSSSSPSSSSSELARSTRISGASSGRMLPTAPMAAVKALGSERHLGVRR